MCFIITLNILSVAVVNLFLAYILIHLLTYDLEKYGIQYLSFQCTVQDLGIWLENIQGGLQSLSPKDKLIRYITAVTGRMELETCGNGKDRRPMELHTVGEEIILILWPSLEIQSVEPLDTEEKMRQNLKGIKPHCSGVKLCGPYATVCEKKTPKKQPM